MTADLTIAASELEDLYESGHIDADTMERLADVLADVRRRRRLVAVSLQPGAYDVERAVFSGRFARQFSMPEGLSLPDQRDIVARLAEHADLPMPTVRRRNGGLHIGSYADPSRWRITMGPTAGPAVVCHEFAHLTSGLRGDIDGYWHGPEWQADYVACVAVIIGDFHAARLSKAFANFESRKARNVARGRRKAAATRAR